MARRRRSRGVFKDTRGEARKIKKDDIEDDIGDDIYDRSEYIPVITSEQEEIVKLKKNLIKVKKERAALKKKIKALEKENEELKESYDRWDILDFSK